jgi:hypothetical protein
MTLAEQTLVELRAATVEALSAWTNALGPAGDDKPWDLIIAGERMAGILVRLQATADTLLARQARAEQQTNHVR